MAKPVDSEQIIDDMAVLITKAVGGIIDLTLKTFIIKQVRQLARDRDEAMENSESLLLTTEIFKTERDMYKNRTEKAEKALKLLLDAPQVENANA